jgi:hypothetical protein
VITCAVIAEGEEDVEAVEALVPSIEIAFGH